MLWEKKYMFDHSIPLSKSINCSFFLLSAIPFPCFSEGKNVLGKGKACSSTITTFKRSSNSSWKCILPWISIFHELSEEPLHIPKNNHLCYNVSSMKEGIFWSVLFTAVSLATKMTKRVYRKLSMFRKKDKSNHHFFFFFMYSNL